MLHTRILPDQMQPMFVRIHESVWMNNVLELMGRLIKKKKLTTCTLRVYSHLSCSVWLNRTQVRFPPWCGSFGQVWIQQSHSVQTKQPYRDPAEEVVLVWFQTNSGTVKWINQWVDDLRHLFWHSSHHSIWVGIRSGLWMGYCNLLVIFFSAILL